MPEQPHVITGQSLRDWPLPEAPGEGGKDSRGSVLVIGGATHTPGAVHLAGLAALRAGAGRLTIATVEPCAVPLAVALPEAGVIALPTTADGGLGPDALDDAAELLEGAKAVVIGPGMTGPADTCHLVEGLLPRVPDDTTVVLDALGLTCGGFREDYARDTDRRVVITPNKAESSYLLKDWDRNPQSEETATVARELARRYEVVTAIRSTVATPDGTVWIDGSGNRGLGTSGSGDVLAGIIAGLACRDATPDQAAVWGVHVHSEAGERLAASVGPVGFLASELLPEIPRIMALLST